MEEKFKLLLDKNEKIIWCGDINVSAYVKGNFLKLFLFGLFPPFALLMLGIPYSLILLILSILKIIPMWIGLPHFAFSLLVCLIYIIILNKSAKNTFFCITNKRIIKRSGVFNNDFVHYSLKNVGNVTVDGSLFDRKGDNPSASLLINVKVYHSNTSEKEGLDVLRIDYLNNAYEAYRIINELAEGHNESFRVKIEK